MDTKMIYICGKCRKESKTKDEIIECEARHLGLTVEEYHQWKNLKREVKDAGINVSICKNDETEMEFDRAVMNLTNFETKHDIPAYISWA